MMKKIFKNKKEKGFVILFAVTISSIILAIAFGISNIAIKELNFTTSARNSNDAFFAADTGLECALQHDRLAPNNTFTTSNPAPMNCNGVAVTVTNSGTPPTWTFVLSSLGSNSQSCAIVTVSKTTTNPVVTTVISKGYNVGNSSCASTSATRVERTLQSIYSL